MRASLGTEDMKTIRALLVGGPAAGRLVDVPPLDMFYQVRIAPALVAYPIEIEPSAVLDVDVITYRKTSTRMDWRDCGVVRSLHVMIPYETSIEGAIPLLASDYSEACVARERLAKLYELVPSLKDL